MGKRKTMGEEIDATESDGVIKVVISYKIPFHHTS